MGHEADAGVSADWPRLDALVTDVIETRRQIAALQAHEARLLADAVDLVGDRVLERRRSGKRVTDADLPLREVSAELGTAMRVSDRTLQRRMGDASALCTRLAATWQAWSDGRIDAGHVAAIVDGGSVIGDDGVRARFESLVLAAAETETPTGLRTVAQSIAARLDPEATAERHQRAQADRRVRVHDLGDGAGRLIADLDLVLARAIDDRLTQLARIARDGDASSGADSSVSSDSSGQDAVDSPDHPRPIVVVAGAAESGAAESGVPSTEPQRDARTIEQLRVDVLADLLLAGAPAAHGDGDALSAVTACVQVTVPALTLAGVADEPALLAGHGPIDTATARMLAALAPGWDRVLTHPFTGAVLAVDRYRPSSDLRRFLRARDERCRFPGCHRPPVRCDVDHTIDAALGGGTSHDNLAHFCRRHHTLKHETAWTVRQRGGGVLEWRSPAGRAYLDHPPARVRFVPTDEARPTRAGHDRARFGDPPPF